MSAQAAANPVPLLLRLYRRHRIAQAVTWLSRIATPLLAGAAALHLLAVVWSGLDTGYVPVVLAALSLVAWVPAYLVTRSSHLRIAREADLVLEARGAVTAAAELSGQGGGRTPWGRAAVRAGAGILEKADPRQIVPGRRFLPVLAPVLAALAVVLAALLEVAFPAKKLLPDPEFEDPAQTAMVPLFNAADEKMLERVHEKLRQKLAQIPEGSTDERVEKLRRKIDEALETFPEDEESYRKFIDDVERLKGDIDELVAEKQAEQEVIEELGESIDAALLEDLAEALEKGDTGEAAEIAQQMAEEFKEKNPPEKKMGKAAEELMEALEKAEELMKDEGGQEGEKAGEQDGGQEGEGGQGAEEMAELLESLQKLAKMFGIKDQENLPEGLKNLAEKFKGMDMSKEQLEELSKLVEGLDNLKNLMAGSGQGEEGYEKLREQFEDSASGQPGQPGQPGQQGQQGQQGQPGQPGQGQQPGQGMPGQGQQGQGQGQTQPGDGTNAGPQGAGQHGDGQGQGQQGQGGQGDGAGNQPGGVTGEAGDAPGGEAGSKDGQGDGQQGWGTGSADHMASTGIEGEGATYEDVQVEGEDNPGPIKKDVILGASKEGFVNEDYRKVYEMYTSILQDILDGEEVPSIYRFYVDKYFELIAPRDQPFDGAQD
jgi:hypothetical protein